MRFVYENRARSILLAEKHHRPGVCVVKYPNNCCHVLGGVELVYQAAVPGFYWRNSASMMAKSIVNAVGGVAFDEKGQVGVIVPKANAFAAAMMMEKTMDVLGLRDMFFHEMKTANRLRLVLAGVAIHINETDIVNAYDYAPLGDESVASFTAREEEVQCYDASGYVGNAVKISIGHNGAHGPLYWTVPTKWFQKGLSGPTVNGVPLPIQWMEDDQTRQDDDSQTHQDEIDKLPCVSINTVPPVVE